MSLTAFDAKEQVRQANDIVAVVGSYLELRRQGRIFVARCPWHDDSRPSLQVNPDRQSWKCWVCDIGGDVFNFIMRREGIDFLEALEMLADKAGIRGYLVDGPSDLRQEWIAGIDAVGVTAGASAPELLVQQVVEQLRQWGGLPAVEVVGREENVVFALPKELRRLA